MNKNNRSHSRTEGSFKEALEELKKRVIVRGDLPHVSVIQQLEVIDQFSAFPLGKFIIEHKGANGFWTDYMISHPNQGKITGLNIEGKAFTSFEDFFLNRCPIVVAHQERFRIFQNLLQSQLRNGVAMASIPCGLMRDLLTLNFSGISDFQLVGIDIDAESLDLAAEFAQKLGMSSNTRFLEQDAWRMTSKQEYDVITSSGLNVYESDPEKVLQLYTNFFKALKPGGQLIISVLTPPPGESVQTDWDLTGIDQETLYLDKVLHRDILEIKWRNFRIISELDREFKLAGFSEVVVYFDKYRVFPTILAKKPN